MRRPLVVAPETWRPLIDALIPHFGADDVASFLGGKPSYNIYDAFLKAQKERTALADLPAQLQVAYALWRTIDLAHAQSLFGVLVVADTDNFVEWASWMVGKALDIPVLEGRAYNRDDAQDVARFVQRIVEVADAGQGVAAETL